MGASFRFGGLGGSPTHPRGVDGGARRGPYSGLGRGETAGLDGADSGDLVASGLLLMGLTHGGCPSCYTHHTQGPGLTAHPKVWSLLQDNLRRQDHNVRHDPLPGGENRGPERANTSPRVKPVFVQPILVPVIPVCLLIQPGRCAQQATDTSLHRAGTRTYRGPRPASGVLQARSRRRLRMGPWLCWRHGGGCCPSETGPHALQLGNSSVCQNPCN